MEEPGNEENISTRKKHNWFSCSHLKNTNRTVFQFRQKEIIPHVPKLVGNSLSAGDLSIFPTIIDHKNKHKGV
jgi:hypothetical protein